MASGVITRAGRFQVEQITVPHTVVPCDMRRPPAGVLHTTEGSWAGAMSVFRQHYAPNFLVGLDAAAGRVRIAQFIPVGYMAAALQNDPGGVETNAWARCQIEIVGYSALQPWLPGEGVCDALAALFDTLRQAAGIPLSRPFPDTLEPGVTWASESNPRRRSGKYGNVSGWYGHVEVPENDHWDCGSLQVRDIFARAPSSKPKLVGYRLEYTGRDGERHTVDTDSPTLWQVRHPKAKQQGRIVVSRRFAKP